MEVITRKKAEFLMNNFALFKVWEGEEESDYIGLSYVEAGVPPSLLSKIDMIDLFAEIFGHVDMKGLTENDADEMILLMEKFVKSSLIPSFHDKKDYRYSRMVYTRLIVALDAFSFIHLDRLAILVASFEFTLYDKTAEEPDRWYLRSNGSRASIINSIFVRDVFLMKYGEGGDIALVEPRSTLTIAEHFYLITRREDVLLNINKIPFSPHCLKFIRNLFPSLSFSCDLKIEGRNGEYFHWSSVMGDKYEIDYSSLPDKLIERIASTYTYTYDEIETILRMYQKDLHPSICSIICKRVRGEVANTLVSIFDKHSWKRFLSLFNSPLWLYRKKVDYGAIDSLKISSREQKDCVSSFTLSYFKKEISRNLGFIWSSTTHLWDDYIRMLSFCTVLPGISIEVVSYAVSDYVIAMKKHFQNTLLDYMNVLLLVEGNQIDDDVVIRLSNNHSLYNVTHVTVMPSANLNLFMKLHSECDPSLFIEVYNIISSVVITDSLNNIVYLPIVKNKMSHDKVITELGYEVLRKNEKLIVDAITSVKFLLGILDPVDQLRTYMMIAKSEPDILQRIKRVDRFDPKIYEEIGGITSENSQDSTNIPRWALIMKLKHILKLRDGSYKIYEMISLLRSVGMMMPVDMIDTILKNEDYCVFSLIILAIYEMYQDGGQSVENISEDLVKTVRELAMETLRLVGSGDNINSPDFFYLLLDAEECKLSGESSGIDLIEKMTELPSIVRYIYDRLYVRKKM